MELFQESRLARLFPACHSSGLFVPITLGTGVDLTHFQIGGRLVPRAWGGQSSLAPRGVLSLLSIWVGEAGSKK